MSPVLQPNGWDHFVRQLPINEIITDNDSGYTELSDIPIENATLKLKKTLTLRLLMSTAS